MKQSTVERIQLQGKVIIGQYTYKATETGEIIRCKTNEVGRMWIDFEGNQYDGWEKV